MIALPLAALLVLGVGIATYARRAGPAAPLLPVLGRVPAGHPTDDLETVEIV
jgi:hypothetical protein